MHSNSNQLTVATNTANHAWLQYLLDEFQRIQGAQFAIIVAENATDEHVLYYTTAKQGDHWLANTGKTETDWLYHAFVLLSRKEEWDAERAGTQIQSYSARHPEADKSRFDVAHVNRYFNRLAAFIQEHFPALQFAPANQPIVDLSHDLDYISKTLPLRLKQTAFNGFNTLKALASPARLPKQVGKTFGFLFSNPSYWCFDYWRQVEAQYQQRSTFYVYVKTKSRGTKEWLLDPSYDVARNKKLQNQLKAMKADGFEIGLHGSFFSAGNEALFAREKEVLEESIGHPVERTRQHWLRYVENVTPHIHNKHVKLDSTIGWNDRTGFRAACASKYRPWDHINQQPFDYFIIPQVVMDSNVFDYAGADQQAAADKAASLLEGLNEFPNSHVSISWHPRTCSSDYNWHSVYERLLEQQFG